MTLVRGSAILQRLKAGDRFLADGAIGTELMARGMAPDSVLRANNLSPQLVRSLHSQYLDAGAMLLTSNTFGLREANDWLENMAAGLEWAAIAARDSERSVGVLFSMLPSLMQAEAETLRRLSQEAVLWPDMILIETCVSLDAAVRAAELARKLDPGLLAITCHFTAEGRMLDGTLPEAAAAALVSSGADVVGANCGDGPAYFVDVACRMRGAVDVPLLFQPNAGLPVPGTSIPVAYPVSADEFADCARRLFAAGVSIVGGCCGTTPAYIASANKFCHELFATTPESLSSYATGCLLMLEESEL